MKDSFRYAIGCAVAVRDVDWTTATNGSKAFSRGRFKESVYQQLRREKVKVVGMNFAASDIKDIDPVVTPMTIYSHSH